MYEDILHSDDLWRSRSQVKQGHVHSRPWLGTPTGHPRLNKDMCTLGHGWGPLQVNVGQEFTQGRYRSLSDQPGSKGHNFQCTLGQPYQFTNSLCH